MNVRLKCSYYFRGGVHLEGKFLISSYTVNLLLLTQSRDVHRQNVALRRIGHMLEYEFDSTVFINIDETKQIKAYQAAGMSLTTLPEDPVDQVIGIMLYHKLNAVAENALVVHDVEISSDLGRDVIYCHGSNEIARPFSEAGWWNDPLPVHMHRIKNKEVIVDFANSWSNLGLDWEPRISNQPHKTDNKVVFGAFKRDES